MWYTLQKLLMQPQEVITHQIKATTQKNLVNSNQVNKVRYKRPNITTHLYEIINV